VTLSRTIAGPGRQTLGNDGHAGMDRLHLRRVDFHGDALHDQIHRENDAKAALLPHDNAFHPL